MDADANQSSFQTPASLAGTYGTFTFNASTGAWTYQLDNTKAATQGLIANQVAHDTLTVTSLDGTTTKTIDVTVTGANDNATITGTATGSVTEDTSVNASGMITTGGTLNVTDVDASQNVFATPTTLAGVYGTFTLNTTTGAWTYAANNSQSAIQALGENQTLTDSITVKSVDGTASQVISVTINGTNDAPVNTVPAAVTINEDGTHVLTSAYANVSDVDSAVLTATINVPNAIFTLSGTVGLTVTGNGTGTVQLTGSAAAINAALNGGVFQPVADFNGLITATVSTSDGSSTTTNTVLITVQPVADIANDTATTNEDTTVNISVNSNDSFENAAHSITAINGTAIAVGGSVAVGHGSVTLKADGTLDYAPSKDYNGADSFTYTVTSGGVTETATVNVTVNPVNDAPVNTVPAAQTTLEDTAKAITGVSVADVDSSALTSTISVLHGSLSVTTGGGATISNNGTGTVTLSGTATQINAALAGLSYTNTSDYNGADTLTVATNDGALTTSNTIGITVTPVADIANDTATTNEDTTVNISVNSNDSFENAAHSITAINGTAIAVGGSVAVGHGSVTLKADGTLDYAPSKDYNGADSFTYTVTSGGVTETATVNVTVNPVNDAPINTFPVSVDKVEDGTYAFSIQEGRVSDVDGDVLTTTITLANGTFTVSQTAGVTVTGDGTGKVTITGTADAINAAMDGGLFRPTADFNGLTSATISTTDGQATTTNVMAINVAPVADIANDTATTNEDTTVNINVNANDSFENAGHTITAINGTAIAVGSSVTVAHGSVTLKADGTLDYAPTANYNGTDSFSYTVTSGGTTETATVSVTINPVNDAPVVTGSTVSGTEDTPLAMAWSNFGISDIDSPTITTVTIATLPADGSLQVYNGSAWVNVTAGQIVSKNTVDAGYLRFTPDANESGGSMYSATGTGDQHADYTSFKVSATDSSGATTTGTVVIDIAPTVDTANIVHDTSATGSVTGGNAITPPASVGLTDEYFSAISTLTSGASSTSPDTIETGIEAATPTSIGVLTNVGPATGAVSAGSAGTAIAVDDAHEISGLMYMEAGKSYVFSGYVDDSFRLEIGGVTVVSGQWGVTGQGSGGTFTATTFTPTVSGYYTVDLFVYNTSGPGSYDVNVAVDGGSIQNLSSSNFYLYPSISVLDAAGAQHGSFVSNATTGEGGYYPTALNSGLEDTAIKLSALTATFGDTADNSERHVITISGVPVGATISDGTHTFTATSGNTTATIWNEDSPSAAAGGSNWDISKLTITPVSNYSGTFSLTATATATEIATGSSSSASTSLSVTVDAVADAPNLAIANASPLVVVSNSWEASANTDTTSEVNAVTTLEGWTRLDAPEGLAGGTNSFEVWTSGDSQQRQNGGNNTVVASAGDGSNFLELNDSAGTMAQTIGITRTISTQADMVYELSLDVAGRPGFTGDYTKLGIYLDGQLLTQASPTSGQTYIDWKNLVVYFAGDGANHTLTIRTDATTFNDNGRGVFLDDIVITATLQRGYSQAMLRLTPMFRYPSTSAAR